MKNQFLFKGPGVALGLFIGLIIGVLTDKIVTFLLLGFMFGLFAEEEYDADHMSPEAKRRNHEHLGTSDA